MSLTFHNPRFRATSGTGVAYSGARLFAYITATSTPQNTYSNSTLVTPNANPVVADGDGLFGDIYLDASLPKYKFICKTSVADGDVTLWTVDPYEPNPSQAELGLILYPRTDDEISASVTPVNYAIPSHDVCGYVLPARYLTNTTPGTTDCLAGLQFARSVAIVSGCRLYFPPETYGISNALTISGKIDFEMAPGALIKALSSYPNPTSVDDAVFMIDANNANCSGSKFTNLNLHGLSRAMGLRFGLAERGLVIGGYVQDMRGLGVYLSRCNNVSVKDVVIQRCGIDALLAGSANTSSLRAEGVFGTRATNLTFDNCTVLDSGGKSIAYAYVDESKITNCFAKGWTDSYGNGYYAAACTKVTFRGNTGIQSAGSSGTNCMKLSNDVDETVVDDNYFEMNTDNDLLHIQNDVNTIVTSNRFKKTVATATGRQHIRITDDGADTASSYILIQANTFIGHANTNTTAIETPSTVSNVKVIGNNFKSFAQGVQVVGANCTVQGNIYEDCTIKEIMAGGSTPRADYSSIILRTTSDQTATGAGASSLTLTLPATVMDRTRSIRVKGSGTKTGATSTKQISFRFGSTDFSFHAAANDTNSWFFEAEVSNVSETSQRVHGVGFNAATALPFVGTAAEDTATALTVGVRANPAGAGDTVVLKMLTIELLP